MLLSAIISFLPLLAVALPQSGPISTPLATGPDPNEVHIGNITALGTGCPAGTALAVLNGDLTQATIRFSDMIAQQGQGVSLDKSYTNCQLTVPLTYPAGYQLSVWKLDTRGHARMDPGLTGQIKTTLYWGGQTNQIVSELDIPGPYNDNYLKTDDGTNWSIVYSNCKGADGLLNVNLDLTFDGGFNKNGLLTVSSEDLLFTQVFHFRWLSCSP